MVVVKANLLPSLKKPIDGGRTFRGKPIFGPNKTWRGVVFMVVCSATIGAVQGALGGPWAARAGVELLDYSAVAGGMTGPIGYGLGYAIVNAVLGFGYALGELPNSFIKRQLEIEPGKTTSGLVGAFFLVLDQADSVIAALALGAIVYGFTWAAVLVGTVCLTALHLAINASLYFAGVRKNL